MHHTLYLLIRLIAFSFVVNLVTINALSQDEWGSGGYDSGGDTNMQPPFNVYSNDPGSFDYAGYNAYMASQEITHNLIDSNNNGTLLDEYTNYLAGQSVGTQNTGVPHIDNLGVRTSNNTYPFKQTSSSSCSVNSVRNAIFLLLGIGAVPPESVTGQLMVDGHGSITLGQFRENGMGLDMADRPRAALNGALNAVGLQVNTSSQFSGVTQFESIMRTAAENGTVFVTVTTLTSIDNINQGNHMIVLSPEIGRDGQVVINVIDSGRPDTSDAGNGLVTTLTPQEAYTVPVPHGGQSGFLWGIQRQ